MRQLSFITVLICSAGSVPGVHAETVKLTPIEVQATQPADLTAPTIEEVRAQFARIPGGATVVDSKTYKTGRSSTPQDALGLATGVFVQPRFGAEESRLSIRGSGIQRTFHGRGLLLMQDGAPINLADGSFDFQTIEPLATEYVEVLRGANAWRYGNATLGGAINFVSPTGKTAAPLDIRGEAGSFGYRRGYAAVAEDFGNVDGFLSASTYQQDGFRDHAKQDNQRYFSNIGGRVNDNLSTRFFLTHVDSDSELPGSLTKLQMRKDPSQANAQSVKGDNKRDFTLNRAGNISALELSDGHSLQLATFYSEKSLFHPIFQVLDVDSDDYGMRLTHLWENAEGWAWRGGLEGLNGRNLQKNYLNVSGRKGKLVDDLHQRARNLNAFTELTTPLAVDWSLISGLTYLHQTRDVDDKLRCNAFAPGCVAQNESFDETYEGHIGRIGVLNDYSDEVQLFSNLSQSFEPPTFADMTGGLVKAPNDAQTANTLEAGLRWQRDTVNLDLALYYSDVSDELLALNTPTGQPLGTVNADQTIHRGIELGGSVSMGAFVLNGQYLLNDFYFDNDPVYGNNQLPGIPRQFVKSELLWKDNGWYVGPTAEWVPTHYNVDMAETLYADSYAIWGFKVGYQMPSGFDLFIEGRNLSDKTYAATTGVIADAKGKDSAQFMPGDGRAVFTGIEWQL